MTEQQKQADSSKDGAQILPEGSYYPTDQSTFRKWFHYYYITHPIFSHFADWLLDNPGALEDIKKVRTKLLIDLGKRPSESHE